MGVEETLETVEQINRANALMRKQKYLDAERIVDKLLKTIEPVEINKSGKVMDFTNNMEYCLYTHMNNKVPISWSRNFLSDIYLMKGSILAESRNFKEAIEYFDKALRWDPVSIRIYREILVTCINLRDYNKFDLYFNRAVQIAMRPIDIAMLYKKLGYVWIERGEDELAYNLILYSKLFFPKREADLKIDLLQQRIGTRLKKYPDLGTIEYIKAKNLSYQRPDYIVPTYNALIKLMQDVMKKEEKQTRINYLTLIDYYNGLYFHKPGGQIHSALLSLQREYLIKFPDNKEEK